jgi:Carboxypeptidase regulatory-like domain/TonB-dependent Receptor Plug Domain
VWCSAGVLSLLALVPTHLTAQAVLGELLDNESGQPVATAQVVLADSMGNVVGRALSDSAGRFFIAVDLGTYSLVVNRLSYEPEHVTDIEITNTSIMALRIRLSPDAVEIPGLLVQGERRVPSLGANGFYDRKQRGFGHFIEVKRLRRLQAIRPSELVRNLPGVVTRNGEVRSTRGVFRPDGQENCVLQVVVDGVYRGANLDDILTVEEIEAIEVYTGFSNVPPKWQGLAGLGYLDITGGTTPTCGVVLVWTRR